MREHVRAVDRSVLLQSLARRIRPARSEDIGVLLREILFSRGVDKTLSDYVEHSGGDKALSSRDARHQGEVMSQRLAEIGGSRFVDGTVRFVPTPEGRIAISFEAAPDWNR